MCNRKVYYIRWVNCSNEYTYNILMRVQISTTSIVSAGYYTSKYNELRKYSGSSTREVQKYNKAV